MRVGVYMHPYAGVCVCLRVSLSGYMYVCCNAFKGLRIVAVISQLKEFARFHCDTVKRGISLIPTKV